MRDAMRFAVLFALAGCASYPRDVERICAAPSRSKYETKDLADREAQLVAMIAWAEQQAGTPEGKALALQVKLAPMYTRAKLLRDAQTATSATSCELADWLEAGEFSRVR